ncbi:MAG: transmembrane anchor protein, partial [Hydrogenophaga sp.]|nr:transmembrane anchor protein [Hydrogenophaga sp.]
MYNAETPLRAELPSSSKLLLSTLLAAISAIVILVAIVLPAEYGVDPTGVGRVLRMTEMGEIKQQLAAEAAADARATPAGSPVSTVAAIPAKAGTAVSGTPKALDVIPKTAVTPAAQLTWRDELTFSLTPGEGKEIKLRMAEGDKVEVQWIVNGGSVNYDTHGDGGGRSISYEKGRSVPADDGALVAAFTGNHGWY